MNSGVLWVTMPTTPATIDRSTAASAIIQAMPRP